MSLNTFRDVMRTQLEDANLAYMPVDGPLGQEIEVDLSTGERVRMRFDPEGNLKTLEMAQEPEAL